MRRVEYEYLCDCCGAQEIVADSPGVPYDWIQLRRKVMNRIQDVHLCPQCKSEQYNRGRDLFTVMRTGGWECPHDHDDDEEEEEVE